MALDRGLVDYIKFTGTSGGERIVYPEVSSTFLDALCGPSGASPELRDVFRKVKIAISEKMDYAAVDRVLEDKMTATEAAQRRMNAEITKAMIKDKNAKMEAAAKDKMIAEIQKMMGEEVLIFGTSTTTTVDEAATLTAEKVSAMIESVKHISTSAEKAGLAFGELSKAGTTLFPTEKEKPEPTFDERQAKDPLWGSF